MNSRLTTSQELIQLLIESRDLVHGPITKNDREKVNQKKNKGFFLLDLFILFTFLLLFFFRDKSSFLESLETTRMFISTSSQHDLASLKKIFVKMLLTHNNELPEISIKNLIEEIIFKNFPRYEEFSMNSSDFLKFIDIFQSKIDQHYQKREIKITETDVGRYVQNILNDETKKKTGSYYTPTEIATFITRSTLETFLLERLKENFNSLSFTSIKEAITTDNDEIASFLSKMLQYIKILASALGVGHFAVPMINTLVDLWLELIQCHQHLKKKLLDNHPVISREGPTSWNLLKAFIGIKYCIPAIYGADTNPIAVAACKIRMFFSIMSLLPREKIKELLSWISNNLTFNLVVGNSLMGFVTVNDLQEAVKNALSTENFVKITSRHLTQVKIILAELLKADQIVVNDDSYLKKDQREKLEQHARAMLDLSRKTSFSSQVMDQQTFINFIHLHCVLMGQIRDIRKEVIIKKGDLHPFIRTCLTLNDLIIQMIDEIWKEQVHVKLPLENDLLPIHWFLEFPKVFFTNSGFDLVIGNPPYLVEVRDNKNIFRSLKRSPIGLKYYEQKVDLFYFFISLGIDLMTQGGILGFIVPEYWINRLFARKLRKKIFSESIPRHFIFFGRHPVFERAPGHHDMILILEKRDPKMGSEGKTCNIWHHQCKEPSCRKDLSFTWLNDKNKRKNYFKEFNVPLALLYDFNNDLLHVSSWERYQTYEKVASRSLYLTTNEVQLGLTAPQNVVTARGLRKVFASKDKWKVGEGIFSLSLKEFRQKKWSSHELTLFRPFFMARDVKAFHFSMHVEKVIIYTDQKNLQQVLARPRQYQNIRSHLDHFQPLITSDHRPYGLHRARQPEWFEVQHKIIGVRKTPQPRFAVVPIPYYVDLSCILIKLQENAHLSPYYVCGILNSSFGREMLHYLKHQGHHLQVDKSVLLKFPIPRPNKEIHDAVAWISKALHCLNAASEHQTIELSLTSALVNLMEQLVDDLVKESRNSRNWKKSLSSLPELSYPDWIRPPRMEDLLKTETSSFRLKILKDLMVKDIQLIKKRLSQLW